MTGLPGVCPILCSLPLLPGAQLLLCCSVLPVDLGSSLPPEELRDIEDWGFPEMLVLTLGWLQKPSHVGP